MYITSKSNILKKLIGTFLFVFLFAAQVTNADSLNLLGYWPLD
jgi:hypothetical protein